MRAPPPNAARAQWWTTQLASLLSAGVPLLAALQAMHADQTKANERRWLQQVVEHMQRGMALSTVLAQYPKVFGATYLATIRGAEASGALPQALRHLAQRGEQRQAWRRQWRTAMAYPLVLLLASSIGLSFMTQWVVPDLAAEFAAQGRALPTLTRVVIAISDAIRAVTPYTPLALIPLAMWAWRQGRATQPGQARQWLLWHVWGLRRVGRAMAMADWAYTLATLLSAGVPLLQALKVVGQHAPQPALRVASARAARRVAQGSPCHLALAHESVFAATLCEMVKLGEQTGQLAQALERSAELLAQRHQSALEQLSRVLEPLLVLLMSTVVGTLVLAMYLPLFDLGNLLQ